MNRTACARSDPAGGGSRLPPLAPRCVQWHPRIAVLRTAGPLLVVRQEADGARCRSTARSGAPNLVHSIPARLRL